MIKYALVQVLLLGEVLFKLLFNYKILFIYYLKIIIKLIHVFNYYLENIKEL